MNNKKHYDAIIIGFGKGGKTLAATLGQRGKTTALIEKSPEMYGGTCINQGCIPTKFLMQRGLEAKRAKTDTEKKSLYRQAVAEELHLTEKLREKNLQKAEKTPNVTVITGFAKFLSKNTVKVEWEGNSEILEGDRIFIDTGAIPVIPPIEGLQDCPFAVTSEALLRKSELPHRLVIIGGGYIGVEFASIYANFGSKVTIIQAEAAFLPREDPDIARALKETFQNRGIVLLTEAKIQRVYSQTEQAVLSVEKGGTTVDIPADLILVATGRRPNTEHLGLAEIGIKQTPNGGVAVNAKLQSSIPHIYAMGDATGGLQFTYLSLDDYRIIRSGILGDGRYTAQERGAIPYSIFTDPPLSAIGMKEKEAIEKGYAVKVSTIPAESIPKALIAAKPEGLLKAIIDENTKKIVGVHLFCNDSHEIINLVKLAMDANLPYTTLRDMIFTHPTMSEAFKELFQF